MSLVEDAAKTVPVIAENMREIRADLLEVRDDQRSLRRALYTAAISVSASSLLFLLGVTEILRV